MFDKSLAMWQMGILLWQIQGIFLVGSQQQHCVLLNGLGAYQFSILLPALFDEFRCRTNESARLYFFEGPTSAMSMEDSGTWALNGFSLTFLGVSNVPRFNASANAVVVVPLAIGYTNNSI